MSTAPTSNNAIELPELEVVEIDALAFATGRIRFVITKRGISVAELARRSLINEGKLGKSMRDERNLRFDEGLRVCHVLDIKPFELLIPPELRLKMDEASRFDDLDVVPSAGRRGGGRW